VQQRDEFIVVPAATAGADGVAALKQLLSELGDTSQLKSLVGSPDTPSRAVVTLSGDEARALTQRYAGRLLMEPNRPLFPSTNSR
jgi:hypothetical protein